MEPYISISSGAYNGHPMHVAFEEVAKIGATHLELIFIHGFSNPFEESWFNAKNARETRALYDAHGLDCGAFAAHMDLSSDQAIEQFIARMDFCKGIGATYMIGYAAPRHCEDIFYRNMETFVRHAEDIGVVIAFENPGDGKRNIIEAARSGAEVIKRLGSDHVKFNYDFGNLMSQYREDILPHEDHLHVIEDTVHLHVKDTIRTKNGWSFPAIGDGEIDFETIFTEYDRRDMHLPLCLEVPVTMTRDVYGIPKMAETPPSLSEIANTLSKSLNYIKKVTGRA